MEGWRLAAWRRLVALPRPIRDAFFLASVTLLYGCIGSLAYAYGDGAGGVVYVTGIGAATALYGLYGGDWSLGASRARVREVRRTGVPSGWPLLDSVALRGLRKPRSARAQRWTDALAITITIGLPVAAAVVRSPWWLLAMPVLGVMFVWDADAPLRAQRLRESLAATDGPSPTLTNGDGSPPRPARPAV